MWGSNLDTTAGYEGGGFLEESRNDDATGDGKTNLKRGSNIVPVMIGHLTSADEEIQFWNIPVRIVTFVGIVRDIEQATTKISYSIEDETGSITALKWLEADKATTEPTIQINNYVRVQGMLREQSSKRHVLVMRIWLVEDLNELTCHLLEVTYATLKAESMANSVVVSEKKNTLVNDEVTDTPVQQTSYYGMTEDQAKVYNIIQAENESESGIERSNIKVKVPKHILPRVNEILDFLVCEGHIYTTCTDDHFKTT